MSEQKRVIVTGATGLIGRPLCRALIEKGYGVVVFSRDPETAKSKAPGALEYVAWQREENGPWATAIDGAYAVIHRRARPCLEKRSAASRWSLQLNPKSRAHARWSLP